MGALVRKGQPSHIVLASTVIVECQTCSLLQFDKDFYLVCERNLLMDDPVFWPSAIYLFWISNEYLKAIG